ncbi:MAG: type II secretion system F family protein [Solirubrobacteraceae bacterium]
MPLLLLIVAVSLVGISARLVVRAAVIPRLALKQHLREIRDYGFDGPPDAARLSGAERLRHALRKASSSLGRFMMRRFPSLPALSLGDLSAAGIYEITPEMVHGFRTACALGAPSLFMALFLASGKLTMAGVLLVIVSAAGGWIVPSFVIHRRGGSRLDEIDRHLPELIDVLIATVEAGMGFAASLNLVAERFQGPIGEELKLTMKRQSLGMTIQQALGEFVERCDTPSLRAFVRTAARGESLGVSIGPVLRELSSDQRRRHRQAAREKMQKAPIKLLFPTMFLIMPALMIVLIYPAAYSVMHSLGGVFG